MSATGICILVLIAIAISIAISYKFNTNLGVIAAVFAYLIGCYVLALKPSEIIAMTPIKIVFQLVAISIMFSFPVQNGTVNMIADHLLYKVRNHTWFLPFALFFIGVILGFLGAPPPAACAIMAVLAHMIAQRAGFHPMLAVLAAVLSGVGADVPYGASGVIMVGSIEELGLTGMGTSITWQFFFADLCLYLVAMVIYYVALKGYKATKIEIEKPEPFNSKQRTTLAIILVVVACVLIPNILNMFMSTGLVKSLARYMDIQLLAIVAVFVMTMLKLGSEKEAIVKGVPWSTIVMVSGICLLIGVAQEAGAVDLLTGVLSNNFPTLWIAPMLCLIAAFLSFFSGAITVVFPLLAALVPGLMASTPLTASALCISIGIGAFATSISPFSTGGAMAMSMCPDEALHKKLFLGQLGTACVNMVLALILSFILGALCL